MVDKTSGDPFWILVNSGDFFKVITQTTGGTPYISKPLSGSDDSGGAQGQAKVLVIEKKFCKVYEKGYQYEDEQKGTQYMINGLLGILNICGNNFVVAITEKQYMGKLDGANIYMIKNAELLPFYEDISGYSNQTVKNYVDGVKKLLVQGFYFSYNTDITSNRQRCAKIRQDSLGGQQSIWDSCDKRYFWNFNICQDFLYQKVDPRWIVPIIQGYVEYKSQLFDGKELEMMLISRRRHGQAGTRYNARGLDDDGNVANYVETEQIMCYKNYIYSFTQIRGSVPLFWQQKGIQAHTSIKRDNELTAQAFDKHLSDMVNDYRLVIFINLLQKARSYEYMLTQALEQQFQLSNPKCVKYTYYDFHTETKGDNFHRLNDLMIKIEDMLVKKFLFYVEDRNTGKIVQEQKGVMRTNCLDCLDRTNVTQTKIVMRIVENILDRIKQSNRKGLGSMQDQQINMMGLGESNDGYLFDLLKGMWAENGDILSKQYAGTGSTITSVTKTGKQGIMGKIVQMSMGVERFYRNNVGDGYKHECIKLFLNQHPQQQQYGIKASLEKQLEKYQQHYMSWDNITMEVFTWNCAGNLPSPTFDISNIIIPEGQKTMPDLYIIGLQEIVKLNAKSVIQGKDKERLMLWEQIISRSLCKKQKYACIASKAMVGCYVLLFIRDDNKNRINNIRTSRVKTGFGGQSGNKGSVAIRFNFDNSSFAFINCHLSSGQSQVSERLEDLREIYKRSFDCSQKYQDFMIQSHDYKVIFGDLNFRIALSFETVKEEVRKCNYAYLWSKDQLLQVRMSNSILNRFSEGDLNFDPTYKYDDHSNSYDTSQKKRIPAWCDRILYEKSEKCRGQIELMHYGRKESFFSDHRPVFAIYKVSVCQIDQKKKAKIELQLLDQLFASNKQSAQSSSTGQQQQPLFQNLDSYPNQPPQSLNLQEDLPRTESDKSLQEANKQFNLLNVNIQDEYLGKNKSQDTLALDELLGGAPIQAKSQEQTFALDELLNSTKKSESMHIVGDLISLSPEKPNHMNSNHAKSVNQQSDLIDLGFGQQQPPPGEIRNNFQYQSHTVNNNGQQNQLGGMQNNYFQFNSVNNGQQQQQDPQQLFQDLFQQPIQQQKYPTTNQIDPKLQQFTGFDKSLKQLQQVNQLQMQKEVSKDGSELMAELFGVDQLQQQLSNNDLNSTADLIGGGQQQSDQKIEEFFQF